MLRTGWITFFSLVRWILLLVSVILLAVFLFFYRQIPALQPAEDQSAHELQWPISKEIPQEHWLVFQRAPSAAQPNQGPLANRFRLAGTFFLYREDADANQQRKAILDDLEKKEQHLVSENDRIDNVEVARIFQDRVILRINGVETELSLGFSDAQAVASPESASTTPAEEVVLETNQFGKRVGENRWVISRETLLGYYQELLDDPERIANLYVSLKPDYNAENQIKGYYLEAEGEQDFFKAMGLQEGDTIRKVNSMNMTSQRRAEYFMSEFVKNRINAFVLDIEREGKPQKMIYMVR